MVEIRLHTPGIKTNIKMINFSCQKTKILKLDGEGETTRFSLQTVYKGCPIKDNGMGRLKKNRWKLI